MRIPFSCRLIICLLAVGSVSGCASLFGDSSDNVALQSYPSRSEYVIKAQDGQVVERGTTPAIVNLPSAAGFFSPASYTVEISKNGFESFEQTIRSNVTPFYYGNILGLAYGYGIFGFLVIDPFTGAMYKLPNQVNVILPDARQADALDGVDNWTEDNSSQETVDDVQREIYQRVRATQ